MIKKKLNLLFSSFAFFATASFSFAAAPDTLLSKDDPIANALDHLVELRYWETCSFSTDTCSLNKNKYAADVVPSFPDLVYEARLAALDAKSPFDLVYNSAVKGYIDLYAVRKRNLVSRMLGMAQVYFPLFEERLDKYDLPLELKYLAIVESALNPNAISKSGATGLWQFMYPTGKMYGLDVNSYVDERRDPYKATEAACKYFIDLYRMFNDWQMVLAAYNGGPGTINKAIRRSGGKKTYWEIRPYLPLETQGYVPAFIAVNYVMNYTSDHNLYPLSPKHIYFVTDTVMPSQAVNFEQLSQHLNLPVEDIQYLNPGYKKMIVPYTGLEKYHLCLPVAKIGQFLSNESSIYAASKTYTPSIDTEELITKDVRKTHVVKRGESVFSIAKKYNCSVQELKSWNHLKSNSLSSGKRLMVYTGSKNEVTPKADPVVIAKNPAIVSDSVELNKIVTTKKAEEVKAESIASKTDKPKTNKFIYYTVQRGDTLWDIASRYNGLTVDRLKKLNGFNSSKGLKPGMKIKVGLSG